MDPQRWAQIEKLYREAAGLPADARRRLLDERCGADTDLRGAVEALLAQKRVGAPSGETATLLVPGMTVGP
jgi:hypothetical protein